MLHSPLLTRREYQQVSIKFVLAKLLISCLQSLPISTRKLPQGQKMVKKISKTIPQLQFLRNNTEERDRCQIICFENYDGSNTVNFTIQCLTLLLRVSSSMSDNGRIKALTGSVFRPLANPEAQMYRVKERRWRRVRPLLFERHVPRDFVTSSQAPLP
jgi:hypothetical protein